MNNANFQGATLNGNPNFQSDNNNQSFQSGLNNETEELFAKVLEEIKRTIQNPDEQQDNIEDLNKVKEAVVSGKKERIVKFFSRLGKGIQISSAGVALAKNLGILALLSL
ncbi:hypothetical protein [Paenibacillus peoriae]|uniref:hypothetical protein n=1 Tax=Paenibacillus peoriae TaxID=59893 RepID=UPI0015C376FF|nr:hypothetical protein [Paenibacillus peoriae]